MLYFTIMLKIALQVCNQCFRFVNGAEASILCKELPAPIPRDSKCLPRDSYYRKGRFMHLT